MVTCDLFEVELKLEQEGGKPYLVWSFLTDLPAGTQVIIACTRTFQNMRGDQCLWTGYNQRLEVQSSPRGKLNGASGRVDITDSDKKALDLFTEINTGFSSGIKMPISDELTLGFMVGARQRIRAFGRNNIELLGKMVTTGGINCVDVKKSVLSPLQKELQPMPT